MKYTCAKCGAKCECPDNIEDINKVIERSFKCPLCYVLIADRKYKMNITGGTTLFSPLNGALGDSIVFQSTFNFYKRDNPDENIIHLDHCDPVKVIDELKPVKFFWASTTNFIEKPEHECIIEFSVAREANALAAIGLYPTLWFEPKPIDVSGFGRYICLSARNITKADWKNAEPIIINRLLTYFDKLVQSRVIDHVVMIGLDDRFQDVYEPDFLIDLRKKVTLQESAYVLSKSIMTVGKDTGTLHLAAAVGSPVIGWGYDEAEWKPKAAPGMVSAIMKSESHPHKIIDLIEERL